ncbi:MAG: HAD-IA family hydrolase [Chthoniobacterales bacterium]
MKALIFDYDGLVVDSEYPEYLSWKEVYAGYNVELTEQVWTSAVGSVNAFDPKSTLERSTGLAFDWVEINLERRRKLTERQLRQTILPGVRELMERGRAEGWRIGVASNSTFIWVDEGLKRLGLRDYVEALRTVDQVTSPKPHPEVYLRVLADLGATAGESLAFEDSQPGITAAKAAGLTVIAVPSALTRHQDLSLADRQVGSLAEFELPLAKRNGTAAAK